MKREPLLFSVYALYLLRGYWFVLWPFVSDGPVQLASFRSFCVRVSSFVISEASRILSSGRVMSEGLITEVLFHCRSLLPIFVSTR